METQTIATLEFEDTADAYGAVQCDDDINNGDTLLVESEGVVGIANTWPVAVTTEFGEFHTIGNVAEFLACSNITPAMVAAAVAVADQKGFPVAQWARDLVNNAAYTQTPEYIRACVANQVNLARMYQSALIMAARKGNAPVVASYRAYRDAHINAARSIRNAH